MTANLYANALLIESDKTAVFEYEHGRASGSSVIFFHTVEASSGSDYYFSAVASNDNMIKISYSRIGVWSYKTFGVPFVVVEYIYDTL